MKGIQSAQLHPSENWALWQLLTPHCRSGEPHCCWMQTRGQWTLRHVMRCPVEKVRRVLLYFLFVPCRSVTDKPGILPKSTLHAKLLIQERTNEILACVCSLPVLNPHPKCILYLAEARSSKYRGCSLPSTHESPCRAVFASAGCDHPSPIKPAVWPLGLVLFGKDTLLL